MSNTPRRDATRNADASYVLDRIREVLGYAPLTEETSRRATVRDVRFSAIVAKAVREAAKEAA